MTKLQQVFDAINSLGKKGGTAKKVSEMVGFESTPFISLLRKQSRVTWAESESSKVKRGRNQIMVFKCFKNL